MHPSQAALASNNSTMKAPSHEGKVSSPRERRRKMALAAGNEKRLQLLHKLGIHDDETKQQLQTTRQPSRGLLDGLNVTNEPLKYELDEEQDDEMAEGEEGQAKSWKERLFFKPGSSLESSTGETVASSVTTMEEDDKRLTFNETVSVVPIPMRTDYSQRVRERLWNNATEIQMNAQRNALEFASEGWDWKTVIEDEYMYRDAASGELIHPVHMEEHYEQQE